LRGALRVRYLRPPDPSTLRPPLAMAWWNKLLGGERDSERVDYYEEGLALLREGKFHDALTSFRLALKESPGDAVVLQQIAIAYTRIGMTEEAARTYRSVLEKEPRSPGAHYGLAFLLLRKGMEGEAIRHMEAFLADPPRGPEAAEHIQHARSTLAELRGGSRPEPENDVD
jgi:Flp pilus assembly protein TadD